LVYLCENKKQVDMANIFNDLNKLVNTVQKVDKLLSEKPKRKRTPIKPTRDELISENERLRHQVSKLQEIIDKNLGKSLIF